MADSVLQTTAFEGMGIRSIYPKELVSCLYAEDNNNLCALEPSISGNDVVISYPQNSAGSSNSFKFNESFPFISQMFSQYQWLSTIIQNAGATANSTVEIDSTNIQYNTDYPAYNLLQDTRFQVSGTEQQIIYGESMIDYMNEILENDCKKDAIFELSGRRNTPMGGLARVVGAGATSTLTTYINQHAFHILPWCDPKGHQIGSNTKPFPVYRCQNGLEIILRLRSFSTLYQSSQATTFAGANTATYNFPSNPIMNNITVNYQATISAGTIVVSFSLSQAYLFFKYHKVASPMMEKKIKMAYPFQTIRNLQTTNIQQLTIPNGLNAYNLVSLQGFAQGQCTNIIFHYVDSSTPNDIYAGMPIDNVKLLFNGKVIFQSNNLQDPMWDLLSANRKSVNRKSRFLVTANNNIANDANYNINVSPNLNYVEFMGYDYGRTFPTQNIIDQVNLNYGRQYYYVIPIAETRLSEYCQLGEFSLGGNFSKESLQLQFRTPTATPSTNMVNNIGTLYITYVYSGIYYMSENRECTLTW